MSHLNNVKMSEQRRVKKKKQINKQATQREQASTSIKFCIQMMVINTF